MNQPLKYFVIISLISLSLKGYSQQGSEGKLKTNAKDTLTIHEMFSTEDGLGDGIRTYKILGKKYAYDMGTLDVEPHFPGGNRKFNDIIFNEAQALYPETQHVFKIEFVIEYDGELTHFRFIWSDHPGIDRKLIKFIRSLPKWTPGIKDNKYVKVKSDFQYGW